MGSITTNLFGKKKSIILVGNSKGLLDKGHGSFIDSHDTVVRFNMGIPWGYEDDVGSKIDIWATMFKGTRKKDITAEFLLRKRKCLLWVEWKCDKPIPDFFCFDDHILTIPEHIIASLVVKYNYDKDYEEETIMEYFRKTSGVHRASTGLTTLYYISHFFNYKVIDVIGFDNFEIKRNYWKNLSNYCEECLHPSEKEKRFLEHMLSENKKINWIRC
jgi:hypothetical protein